MTNITVPIRKTYQYDRIETFSATTADGKPTYTAKPRPRALTERINVAEREGWEVVSICLNEGETVVFIRKENPS